MKKLNFVIAIAFLFPFYVFGQHYEAGIWGGGATYMGDLVPERKALSTGSYHYAGGAFLRYNHSELIAVKLGLSYGHIGADDADATIPRSRNLSFRSSLTEASLVGELNLLGYDSRYSTRIFSPYAFMGISFFHFNPKARLSGGQPWYELQPLGTEGQGLEEFPFREPYKLTGIAIPMGVGLKFALSDVINLGAEIGMRKTFTDYLDDVSTTYAGDDLLLENGKETTLLFSNRSDTPVATNAKRGNPDQDDWFIFGGFSISFNIDSSGGGGKRRRRPMGCPTF